MTTAIPQLELDVLRATTSNFLECHIVVLVDNVNTKWTITVFGHKPVSDIVTKRVFIYSAST